ncbi:hypothetical protein VSDG_06850 [Cytospora chrysosperma]|uniref:Uncharacterized protein n=1 Tax=Cytospora chrysosperma TaxID=252740 RepID=A0A423VQH2_CYTCH|nr:hypothetical protein VSDG_06850 [Valsa sordida]
MASSTEQAVIMDPLPQGPSCLLLNRAPREIRDMIYRFTFRGAKVSHKSWIFIKPITDPSQLLFTCRQIYNEARPVLCSEVRLVHYIIPPDPDLGAVLSDFNKAHVRHLITHMYDWSYPYQIQDFLSQFPSLRTCILPRSNKVLKPPEWNAIFKNEQSVLADIVEDCLLGQIPESFASGVHRFKKVGDDEWEVICENGKAIPMPSGMNSHSLTGPQTCLLKMGLAGFAERITFCRKFIYRERSYNTRIMVGFLNYTTGKFFLREGGGFNDADDDEGYRRVMSKETATDG